MTNHTPDFEDWVNGIARPVIGLLLGLALGAIIRVTAQDGLVTGLIAAAVLCVIWFGLLAWRKLEEKFGKFLFGSDGLRPPRTRRPAPGHSLPARVARYGLPIGIVIGCLAELLMPQSLLSLLV